MNKRPRKNGESIFADGGYFKVGLYSVIIAVITLIAFLYTPVKELSAAGTGLGLKNIIDCFSNKQILMQSQTLAFCTLVYVSCSMPSVCVIRKHRCSNSITLTTRS